VRRNGLLSDRPSLEPAFEVLCDDLVERRLLRSASLVDGLDDLLAAERIGAAFLLAGWGYGTDRVLEERPDVNVLAQPHELLDRLAES
jgi:phosphoglycolate phosphatase-like HAD superfamily hydrolase